MSSIDDPAHGKKLNELILKKKFLRKIYEDIYAWFAQGVQRCPANGVALEIGSGAGFLKQFIPDIHTSDVLPYPGIDQVVDAVKLPFPDGGLRAICMFNVFHHLPDVEKFLREAQRCLAPGGRVLMVDQYPGWISTPILTCAHHEPFDRRAPTWAFTSTGPLSGANGALAWIVFERDRQRFETIVPQLKLERYEPCLPLSYWLAGGLKPWTLIPGWAAGAMTWLDRMLLTRSPKFGSFVKIELVRQP